MTKIKKLWKHILKLGIIVCILSFNNVIYAEVEPNDTLDSAIPLNVGLSNAEINATLTAADLDYYAFTAVAGRTYAFETFNIQGTGTTGTGLWLYDSSGTEITNDGHGRYGTGNADARIRYTFATTGTYYLLVQDQWNVNWAGTYSLRILPKHDEPEAEWDIADDYEPNDSIILANSIDVGLKNAQTHVLFNNSNFITNDSDHDYYTFEVEAEKTYVIETYNVQGTGQTGTGLWLYDSSGTEITNDGHGRYGTGDADARIVYKFSTSGTYYLLVKDQWNVDWKGTYSLRILPKHDEDGAEWDSGNDYEPNDTRHLANKIEVGLANSQTHELFNNDSLVSNDSDHDYYAFEVEAEKTYVIETYNVQGTGQTGTGLWLYDSSGTEITNDGYGRYGTGDADARIVYKFSTSGIYYILVKDQWNVDWKGTYSLRILPKHDEAGASWDATNENEPNDVAAIANELLVGLANVRTHTLFDVSNFVTNGSDHDYYHFTAEANKTYVIETLNIQNTGGRATGIWLYDSSGTLITEDRYGRYGTGVANARITYTFSTSGTYYILVKEATSTAWTGTYSIRILQEGDNSADTPSSTGDGEPNDVLLLANKLEVGGENGQSRNLIDNSNFVSENPDYDFYSFEVQANLEYILQTYNVNSTGRATGIWLYDSSGKEIKNDARGSSATGEARIVHRFTQPGEYFLLVTASLSNRDWAGSYSVQVCEESCVGNLYLPFVIR